MFFKRRNKHERYYLFPGMGGKSFRRKQRMFFIWSVVFALVAAGILALVFLAIDSRAFR
jgi:hypothetical protein